MESPDRMESAKIESNQHKKSYKPKDLENWEITAISKFLLWLFHKQIITIHNDFYVEKKKLYAHFHKFLKLPENSEFKEKYDADKSNFNIGSLLNRTNFVQYVRQRPNHYKIKNSKLFQYSNKQRKKWDDERIKSFRAYEHSSTKDTDAANISTAGTTNGISQVADPELSECFRIADDATSYFLEYQGTGMLKRDANFSLSNMGCYICQCNFDTAERYEQHLEWHGDESDFESLKELTQRQNPITKLSYKVCKDSHYFSFNLSTTEDRIVIEKIVIVQSRSVFYVNNNLVPYEIAALQDNVFFVDSHLFSIHVEQPVVIVFHYKFNEALRFIEQHHFMRSEKFPEVNFSILSNRLPNRTVFKPTLKLREYLPSDQMKKAQKHKFLNEDLYKILVEFRHYMENGMKISLANVDQVLTMLLQIDDMDAIQKLAGIRQRNARIRRVGDEYSVRLKNTDKIFVENILSKFDEVFIASVTNEQKPDSKKKKYFGIVQHVVGNRVVFKCDKKLLESEYNVDFRPSRLMLRYQYKALKQFADMPKLLKQKIFFPNSTTNVLLEASNVPSSLTSLKLFNPSIAGNAEQLQAVNYITSGHQKNAPYVIFGPPGTGKTTTVVEAIVQLYTRCASNKILVAAASNTACDEIALRLCKILGNKNDNRAMVRIYAKSYEKRLDDIDEELLDASNIYGAHFYPDIATLHEYRIIVCTFGVVGKLGLGNFGKGGSNGRIFTHTFIDEIAASTIPEALIAITCSVSLSNYLIISGDHKQLGPVLLSDRAKELGLGLSLMDYLLELDCYKPDEFGKYNCALQTRLKRNHRSHQKIVDLYSNLFYNNELMACAKSDDVNWGSKWHNLPNPDYPIMFHSVFGKCLKGSNSLSWYNDMELEVVMDYVKELLCYGINGKDIGESDIGIISPYKSQYLRIQEELNLRKMHAIETGSVEIFQGKEKQVIIVSFVRSFTNTLGFLADARRLNVILSRAKSLIIIVGNPKTLAKDQNFRTIIESCRSNKTMVGSIFYQDKPTDGNEIKSVEESSSRKSNTENEPTSQDSNKLDKTKNKKPSSEKKFVGQNKNKSNEKPLVASQMKTGLMSFTEHMTQQQKLNNLRLDLNCLTRNRLKQDEKPETRQDIDTLLQSLPRVPQTQLEMNQNRDTTSVLSPPLSGDSINNNNNNNNRSEVLPKDQIRSESVNDRLILKHMKSVLRAPLTGDSINNNNNNRSEVLAKDQIGSGSANNRSNDRWCSVPKPPVRRDNVNSNRSETLGNNLIEFGSVPSTSNDRSSPYATASGLRIPISRVSFNINHSERVAREVKKIKSEKKANSCVIS